MGQVARSFKSSYGKFVAKSLDRSSSHLPMGANGGFALLGVITAALGVALLLTAGYLRQPFEPAGMFTNFVSSLGWGGNGSHEIFQVGLTLLAALMLPYILFLILMLRHQSAEHTKHKIYELTHHSAGAWYIAAMGLWLLAWFVDIRVPNLEDALLILLVHTMGAALFFIASAIGASKLTAAMELHGIASRAQHWFVRSTILNAVAMLVSIIPLLVATYNAGYFEDLLIGSTQFLMTPEQRVAWIKDVTSNFPWVAFFEWGTVFSLLGWIAASALQLNQQPSLVFVEN